MWNLFVSWIVGVVFRFGFAWAFNPAFSFKVSLKQVVLSLTIGLPITYSLDMLGMHGWFFYVVSGILGFLSQFGLEWLNRLLNKRRA